MYRWLLVFLIIEKRIYYLWTKPFGSDGHTHTSTHAPTQPPIDCINIPDTYPKIPKPTNPRSFKKVKKSGKKSQKRHFFINIFRKLKSFFVSLNNITSCLIHNIVRRRSNLCSNLSALIKLFAQNVCT